MSLTALGLTVREERVYRSLLARNAADLATLAHDVGLDPRTCERALAALHRRRLLEVDDHVPLGMRVRLPSLALAELAQRVAERLGDDLVKIAGVQAEFLALDELAREPPHPAAGATGAAVAEVVRGETDVARCMEQLAQDTTSWLDSISESPRSARQVHAAPDISRSLRRGVAIRWIVHDDVLSDERYQPRIHDVMQHGGAVRSTAEPLTRLLIADRAAALVPDDARNPSQGLVIIRHSVLVERLQELFETTWRSATPMSAGDTPASVPTAARFGDVDRQLLQTLAMHATDELAARALFISVRQLQRRVTAAFQRLGAANRFHAGVLAERLGLVEPAPEDDDGSPANRSTPVDLRRRAPTRRRG